MSYSKHYLKYNKISIKHIKKSVINKINKTLLPKQSFKIKAIGKLKYFVGLEVAHSQFDISLCKKNQ